MAPQPPYLNDYFLFRFAFWAIFCCSRIYDSSGVSESRQSMKCRLILSSSFLIYALEYFDMSEPFGMYRLSFLFKFSMLGFCHGECGLQKYILMCSFFSNRLCSRKRMSLSKVIVCSSGNRFLIRTSARSIAFTDTGKILSRKFLRTLRSLRANTIPLPLLPETMKSPSVCPNPHRRLIFLGRSEIIRFPSIRRFFPPFWRLFLNTCARCSSIFLP